MSLQKFDGQGWQNLNRIKRYTSDGWAECGSIRRWDGEQWVKIWPNLAASASLSPESSLYDGGIAYSDDRAEVYLTVGYYDDGEEHHYQTGAVRLDGLRAGQTVSFTVKMNYTSYDRHYQVSGLTEYSGSTRYSTASKTFTGTASGTSVTIACSTDFSSTLYTISEISVDGNAVLFQ